MNRPNQLIQKQRGAVAIMVGLSIAVLIGMIGLALDLGRMFVIKTELQNTADACALAAAKELDGKTNAKARADTAGILVGTRNVINFQDEAATVTTANITYSDELNGSYSRSVSDADAKYVKCTLSKPDVGMLFMRVRGFGLQSVGAFAVASLLPSQSPCVLPIGFCKDNTPPSNCPDGSAPDSNGLCIGEWGSGRFDSGGGQTGAFNWLQFPGLGNGESVLADLIVTGYCGEISGTTVQAKEGLADAAEKAWNSRFGLYKPGKGQGNYRYDGTPPATSDKTGFSYTTTPQGQVAWPSQRNAYADFLAHENTNDPYQGNGLTGLSVSNSYNSSSAALAAGNKDRRVVTVPVVDCTGWGSSHTTTLSSNFACVLLLHPIASPGDVVYMEYRGIAGISGSPCPSYGLPGGGGAEVPGLVQ